MSKSVQRYISLLMESRTQAHKFHLTTKSFAEHKVLQAYYEGIVPCSTRMPRRTWASTVASLGSQQTSV